MGGRGLPILKLTPMRDRLVLLGAGLLALAVLGSVWLALHPLGPTADAAPAAAPMALATPTPADTRVAAVVHLDGTPGAAAFAQPGDRVDVLVYLSADLTGSQAVTRRLLADVPVLASPAKPHAADAQTLTLAVTPEQALLLQQAEQLKTRTFVVLRSETAPASAAAREAFGDQDVRPWLTRPSDPADGKR